MPQGAYVVVEGERKEEEKVPGEGPSAGLVVGAQEPWATPATGLQLEGEFCGHFRGTVV